MVVVCAWCERFLGIKPSKHGGVSHGICRPCQTRQRWQVNPTLVVDPTKAELLPVFKELLRGKPEIVVVLDRRQEERRDGERRKATVLTRKTAGRRKTQRRRRGGLNLS